MAKNNELTEVEATTVQAENTEPAEKPAKKAKETDPWKETVNVVVPRKPKGEEQQYYICINDRRYAVPANGKNQDLPRPVAEVLLAAIEADYKADEFADSIPNMG